jgi:hypothetical protein
MNLPCLIGLAATLNPVSAVPVVVAGGQTPSDYQITINGTQMDLNLDQDITYNTAGGDVITIRVHRKDAATYKDKYVTFTYPTNLSVAKSAVQTGVDQLLMATANGTVVMVQEYDEMDPTQLVDLLLNSVVSDDIKEGWHQHRTEVSKKLADGHVLTGKQDVLTYGEEKSTVEVLAYDNEDRGVAIVTQISGDNVAEDGKVLSDFWQALALHY